MLWKNVQVCFKHEKNLIPAKASILSFFHVEQLIDSILKNINILNDTILWLERNEEIYNCSFVDWNFDGSWNLLRLFSVD